jgi:hypothetical protein
MNKRLMSLVPLLAVAAFVVGPAVAQAEPHWYKKGILVGSAPVTAATAGNLVLTSPGSTVVCKVNDAEEIWNPVGGGAGEDLMTSFNLTKCKNKMSSSACPKGAVEVFASGLPWISKLVGPPGGPIKDEILKVRLTIRCFPGTVGDEFQGTLSPEVGNGDLIFGPGSGTLLDTGSNPLTLGGKDNIIAPKGKVTATNP